MPTRPSTNNARPVSASNGTGSAKWTESVRALPSSSESNDYLKTDYIDVNLNNSRKLIENINQLSDRAEIGIKTSEKLNQRLSLINDVLATFEWLEDL